METPEKYIPQPVTSTDLILDAYLSKILAETARTNELLEKLLEKPKANTRKRKEDS